MVCRLPSVLCMYLLPKFCPDCSCRSRNSAEIREGENPGVHALPTSAGQAGGVLRRPVHREAGLWVGWDHRVQWQLPGPGERETRVEEVHRWAIVNVLLCQWQVSETVHWPGPASPQTEPAVAAAAGALAPPARPDRRHFSSHSGLPSDPQRESGSCGGGQAPAL